MTFEQSGETMERRAPREPVARRPLVRPGCRLGFAAALLLLAGCASVKVEPSANTAEALRIRPPEVIFLRPFDITTGEWNGAANAQGVRMRVRDTLVARLEDRLDEIAPVRLEPEGQLPRSGWLISGRFIRVNPGHEWQRVLMGVFGAGATRLETKVDVYDLAVSTADPILSFKTAGGTNQQLAPQNLFTNEVEADLDRTAREIRDYLKDHLWKPVERT